MDLPCKMKKFSQDDNAPDVAPKQKKKDAGERGTIQPGFLVAAKSIIDPGSLSSVSTRS